MEYVRSSFHHRADGRKSQPDLENILASSSDKKLLDELRDATWESEIYSSMDPRNR